MSTIIHHTSLAIIVFLIGYQKIILKEWNYCSLKPTTMIPAVSTDMLINTGSVTKEANGNG